MICCVGAKAPIERVSDMFEIFVDSGANIPAVFVEKYDINVIAL